MYLSSRKEGNMAIHQVRLGSFLSFDEDKEKDLISFVENLNATHSMGKFISSLIRLAVDNPELIQQCKNGANKDAVLKQIGDYELSRKRYDFFRDIKLRIEGISGKVNSLYNMAVKNLVLATIGKRFAMEEKSKAVLATQFIIEKQLKDLSNSIGEPLNIGVLESDKLEKLDKKVEDLVEFIINSYDGLLKEVVVQSVSVAPADMQTTPVAVEQQVTTVSQVKVEETPKEENNADIDFDNADMNMLENFFNQ